MNGVPAIATFCVVGFIAICALAFVRIRADHEIDMAAIQAGLVQRYDAGAKTIIWVKP